MAPLDTGEIALRALELATANSAKLAAHEKQCAERWATVSQLIKVMIGVGLSILGTLAYSLLSAKGIL